MVQRNCEGSFACDVCHKKFAARTSRDAHVRSAHTGEKLWCPFEGCHEGFYDTTLLGRHRKSKHEADKAEWWCAECTKRLGTRRDNALRHVAKCSKKCRKEDIVPMDDEAKHFAATRAAGVIQHDTPLASPPLPPVAVAVAAAPASIIEEHPVAPAVPAPVYNWEAAAIGYAPANEVQQLRQRAQQPQQNPWDGLNFNTLMQQFINDPTNFAPAPPTPPAPSASESMDDYFFNFREASTAAPSVVATATEDNSVPDMRNDVSHTQAPLPPQGVIFTPQSDAEYYLSTMPGFVENEDFPEYEHQY